MLYVFGKFGTTEHARTEACAHNEDRNSKLQGICHEQNHEIRSGYSRNCINNLGNPSRIRPDNEFIIVIQKNLSSDTTLGDEAIGQ